MLKEANRAWDVTIEGPKKFSGSSFLAHFWLHVHGYTGQILATGGVMPVGKEYEF